MSVPVFLAIVLAGALGAVVRYAASVALARWPRSAPASRLSRFPWPVLAVNVIGSFIGGLALAGASGDARVILLSGLCGGLTTFSALSVETVQLVLDGEARVAVVSVVGNVGLGLAAVGCGLVLG